jgi:hypothetical protein
MLTSMKNMTRVLIDLDPNPARPEISRHISQSIRRARNLRPVPALTMFQGYLFASRSPAQRVKHKRNKSVNRFLREPPIFSPSRTRLAGAAKHLSKCD